MNVWEHSLIGQRKFGGRPEDYVSVHRFLDSSKYFFYHVKHRLLLHNLYGVELAVDLFGDVLLNADGVSVPVRDVAVAHIREDLDGKIPTLTDWFATHEDGNYFQSAIPDLKDEILNRFLWKPYLRSGTKDALIITCSDFGVSLMETFHGAGAALQLREALPQAYRVSDFLQKFTFTQRWQYTPQQEELNWLKGHRGVVPKPAPRATDRERPTTDNE
jgi:hypothetical protein